MIIFFNKYVFDCHLICVKEILMGKNVEKNVFLSIRAHNISLVLYLDISGFVLLTKV